jgi:hypothetical protein
MPKYKYISNRFLTAAQNALMGTALSEFHTGYRAFAREVLLTLPLAENDNGRSTGTETDMDPCEGKRQHGSRLQKALLPSLWLC